MAALEGEDLHLPQYHHNTALLPRPILCSEKREQLLSSFLLDFSLHSMDNCLAHLPLEEVSSEMNLFVLYFIVYALIGTAIAFFSRRMGVKSTREYYTAGGRMGALLSGATYAATTYSAFMMIGLVGMSYSTGSGALGFELLYLLSTVAILATLGFEIWKKSKEKMWISPSQMIGDLYSSSLLSKIVSLVFLFAMVPYISAQIMGLGVIFQMGGMSYAAAVISSGIIVASWIVIAGMWSLATTDLYNALLMLGGGIIFFSSVAGMALSFGGFAEISRELSRSGYLGITGFWSFPTFLSYTIPWMFFAITNPQVVSRLFIQKDERAYKLGASFFASFGLFYTLLSVSIGLLARFLALEGALPGNLMRDYLTPTLLTLMSPSISGIIAISIIAAAVSTANGIIISVSSSIFTEFLHGKKKLAYSAALDLALTFIASAATYLKPSYIVELSVITSLFLLPLAPITIVGLKAERYIGRASRLSAAATLIIGDVLAFLALKAVGASAVFTSRFLGLPISALVLLISSAAVAIGLLFDAITKKRGVQNG